MLVSLVDGIAVGAASDGPGSAAGRGTPPGVGSHGPAQPGRLPATRVLARTTWAGRGDDRPGAAGRPPGPRKLMNRRRARSVLQVTTVYLAGSPPASGSPRRRSGCTPARQGGNQLHRTPLVRRVDTGGSPCRTRCADSPASSCRLASPPP